MLKCRTHLLFLSLALIASPLMGDQPWSSRMEQIRAENFSPSSRQVANQRVEHSRKGLDHSRPEGAGNEEYGAYANYGFGCALLATNGRIVILENGLNITIVRVEDPEHPVVWDVPFTNYTGCTIKMVEDLAYVLIPEGLQSWNLADPAHPVLKRTYRQCGPYYFTDFAIAGHYALLSGNHEGIGVLDLDGDGLLYNDSVVPSPPGMHLSDKIIVSGHYAIVTDNATPALGCYDITDPGRPMALWAKAVPGLKEAFPVIYEPPYLVTNYQTLKNPGGAFAGETQMGIFYLPDPGNPSSFDPRPVNAACPVATGSYLCMVAARWPMVYFGSFRGLEAVDASNPASPQPVSNVDLGSYHPYAFGYDVAVVGDRIFLAGSDGLWVFDLSLNRQAHLLVGSTVWGGYRYYKPLSLTPDGDLGLVNMTNEGVVLMDFSSGRPKRLGTWENTEGGGKGFVNDSVLTDDGQYAFVATDDWSTDALYRGKLNVLEFKDPLTVVNVGELAFPVGETEWFPTDLTRLDANHLLVVLEDNLTGNCRLDILDISRPMSPTAVGIFGFPAGAVVGGLTVADGYVGGKRYVVAACGQNPGHASRLINVDITDLAHPSLALDKFLLAYGPATSVALIRDGGHPYAILASLASISVVDLTDPSSDASTVVKDSWGAVSRIALQSVWPISRGGPDPQFTIGNGWGEDYAGTFLLSLWPVPYLHLVGEAEAYGEGIAANAALQPSQRTDGRIYNAGFHAVGYYPNIPDYSYPSVAGPISLEQGQDITEPIQFTVQGVADDVGISKVEYWILPYATAGCWQLMEVQHPTEYQGTYTFTLDPTKVWNAGDRVVVRVVAYNTAGMMGFLESDYINIRPTAPLEVQTTQTPASGRLPLTVAYHVAATGGDGSYHIRWQFGDQWVNGNDVQWTYTEAGDWNWRVEVEDGYHQIAVGWGSTQVLPALSTPVLASYQFLKNPFRVRLTGSGIRLGCQVFVNGTQARWITDVSESTVTAGKGAELKALLPKRRGVPVVVVNPDGGTSNTLNVTR